MTVTINAPFRVVLDGTAYTAGDTLDAPEDDAAHWIISGWATEVTTDQG